VQAGAAGATQEARQKLDNTYVKLTDESARRHAKGIQHPLLIKRSDVYGMAAAQVRSKWEELGRDATETTTPLTPEVLNTIARLEGEMDRRKSAAKRTYARRKAENSIVNVVDNTATM